MAAFGGQAERLERNEALSDAERAELDRIASAYPVREFGELMQTSLMAFMLEDVTLGELGRCEEERSSAFERIGIRTYEDGTDAPEAAIAD